MYQVQSTPLERKQYYHVRERTTFFFSSLINAGLNLAVVYLLDVYTTGG